jgi:hypothetical protein
MRAGRGHRVSPPPVKAVLAAALAVVAVALVLTLAHSPLKVVRGNSATAAGLVTSSDPSQVCQTSETLPAGTTAVRLALFSVLGPKVSVQVLSGPRVLAEGAYPPGWSSGTVTVPVKPLARTVAPVEVCFTVASVNAAVTLRGWAAHGAAAAFSGEGPLPGRMGIEFLRPGRPWWVSVGSIVRRLGYGHALGGLWNAALAAALAAALLALTSWLVLKELP